MERTAFGSQLKREYEELQVYLHPHHGWQAGEIRPVALPRHAATTAAEGFAAQHGPTHVQQPLSGVPCRIIEGYLHINYGSDGAFLVDLFLAEVSFAAMPAANAPGAVVLAVALQAQGVGLSGLHADPGGVVEDPCNWFVVTPGPNTHLQVVDALSRAGCVRQGLDQHFDLPIGSDGLIGEGAYATVHCMRSKSGTPVAVKNLHATVDLGSIEREVQSLLIVQHHEHIVGFRGLFCRFEAQALRLSLVFDIAPCGDVLKKVMQFGMMTEELARPLILGITSGLAFIHSKSLVHRDVKAENILLKRPDCTIISDFGLATVHDDPVQMARRCGSPGYVAPEVCIGNPYGFKVDVFGAGVVLYFMLSQEMPFSSPDRDVAATMRKTVKCGLHLHRPPWDTKTSHLRNILRQMMYKDPAERLSSEAAMVHPWMKKKPKKEAPVEEAALQPGGEGLTQPPPPAPAGPGGIYGNNDPLVSDGYPGGYACNPLPAAAEGVNEQQGNPQAPMYYEEQCEVPMPQ